MRKKEREDKSKLKTVVEVLASSQLMAVGSVSGGLEGIQRSSVEFFFKNPHVI